MDKMMDKMSKEEKKEIMDSMMGRFFADMTPEEKREMMQGMMPRMMEGITAEDRRELMRSMMPPMMSQMFAGGREWGSTMMDRMMNMMRSEVGEEGPPRASSPETPEEEPGGMMEWMGRMMERSFTSMSPEEMTSTMHEIVPRMMESCFSQMNAEQRKGMLSMCRGILDDIEKKYE